MSSEAVIAVVALDDDDEVDTPSLLTTAVNRKKFTHTYAHTHTHTHTHTHIHTHTPGVHRYFAFSLAANVNILSSSRALAISFQEAVIVVFSQNCNTSSLHLSTPSCGLIFFNSYTGTFK